MPSEGIGLLARVMTDEHDAILTAWSALLKQTGAGLSGRIRDAELQTQARTILERMQDALASGGTDREAEARARLDDEMGEISRSRALQGFTSGDTANFVFSLKEPLFDALHRVCDGDAAQIASGSMAASRFLDRLAIHTMQVFQTSREEVISRQSQEIAELSTPVVQLWRGILALPLIGTLDSARTGVVMETLLQAIVDEEAEIAIIDITGVPTVDTLVAQHLLKTIAAARLMGADCIISGIRPQIAQTMVHLGVELNVISKATLADAFAVALKRTGRTVVRVAGPRPSDSGQA